MIRVPLTRRRHTGTCSFNFSLTEDNSINGVGTADQLAPHVLRQRSHLPISSTFFHEHLTRTIPSPEPCSRNLLEPLRSISIRSAAHPAEARTYGAYGGDPTIQHSRGTLFKSKRQASERPQNPKTLRCMCGCSAYKHNEPLAKSHFQTIVLETKFRG